MLMGSRPSFKTTHGTFLLQDQVIGNGQYLFIGFGKTSLQMPIDSQSLDNVIEQGGGATKKSGVTARRLRPPFLVSLPFLFFKSALVIDDFSRFRIQFPDAFSFVASLLFVFIPITIRFVYISNTVLFVFQLDNRLCHRYLPFVLGIIIPSI